MKKQMRIAATLAAGVLVCGALLFSGCEKDGANNESIIDCYSMSYNCINYEHTDTYQMGTRCVYEYKNKDGDVLYTDTYLTYYIYSNDEKKIKENIIFVYQNRYTAEYTEYTFSKFVGWVTFEKKLYYNLDTKILDTEIKFSEYKYEKNPDADSENKKENVNNKGAYNAIKKNGYYCVYDQLSNSESLGFFKGSDDYIYQESAVEPASIYLDLAENGLSRHEYTIFSESDRVTYRAKWF